MDQEKTKVIIITVSDDGKLVETSPKGDITITGSSVSIDVRTGGSITLNLVDCHPVSATGSINIVSKVENIMGSISCDKFTMG